ncbi:hypothetical protein B0J13DRAFT_625675 [Dactylonectria estremocensis]|uniref:Uncharacterized protein n=1 Tax=Dactylonectria estremocensis TaxID=1079267 RepID=A0A9P9EI40_9HYPO|nr:hypothetical protein B0J13DRAFT_625675 [Dactylonectria estremocensis]
MSQEHARIPDTITVSRLWDVDSVWLRAKSLATIRPPHQFEITFLPPAVLNISSDQGILPHSIDLARTRHIVLSAFNMRGVRFHTYVFFPSADICHTKANALSLERQKELYNNIIFLSIEDAAPAVFR